MSFCVTGGHVCVVLILLIFVYPFARAGTGGWVVETAGYGGGSIWQGLGCWPTVRLLWAPDLHL